MLALLSCIETEKQARYNLIFADLLQVVETTCIKLVDKKSCQRILISACSRLAATCAFLAVYVKTFKTSRQRLNLKT